MQLRRRWSAALGALATVLCLQSTADAHPVTVDGATTDWLTREPAQANLGLIARAADGSGEFVWRDLAGDTRTDVASPETVADITYVRVTSSAAGLSFLITLNNASAHTGANPVQLQIAIDNDRAAGSGQNFFAGLADTTTAEDARWERLIQTQFTAGSTARVIDTSFNPVGAAVPVGVGTTASATNVEMTVPWAQLGLTAPPATPLRFTIASFREQAGGNTVAIGDSGNPNAIDVVSSYGSPAGRLTSMNNTFNEFALGSDLRVDYNVDVFFDGSSGDVYAPLVVSRFVSNATNDATNGGDWVALRNVTPNPISTTGVRVGDEETVGAGEAMLSLPTATIAPGGTFVLALHGANYNARYGEFPDAERTDSSASVANAVPDTTTWATASNFDLATNDEILVLDRSFTMVDVVTYGSSTFLGLTAITPSPAVNTPASRNQSTFADTDNNLTDFTVTGTLCADDSTCGACGVCTLNVCAPRAAGTSCRASTGLCDAAEVCDGTATACPADGFAAAGTVCRASAGTCDVAETCSGTTAACPADGFVTGGTVCRAAAGVCDAAEVCTGSAAACPSDSVAPMTVVCRASAGACDVAETCDGITNTCPADLKASAATTCRAAGGVCDVAETCDGTSDLCPTDTFAASTTVCRPQSGACDAAETCSGSAAACPADGVAAATTVCRASAGACDVAESCDGTTTACPADSVAPNTTVCRASAGACDVAETCDGASVACPMNAVLPSTTVCRASAGACDVAETCDGTTGVCPTDSFAPSTTECRASAGACDQAESCSGSSAACPVDRVAPATTVCRASAGVCDVAESCDGTTGVCPADSFAPSTTLCRAAAGVCDLAESCSGSSAACPVDLVASSTTVCRAAAGVCDVAETCDGAGTACPTDGFASMGTACADSDRCNGDETCNGMGTCSPGTPVVCAPSGNACQSNTCNSSTGSCVLGNLVAGTSCSDGVFCNGEETCNGMGTCTMGTTPTDAGTFCVDGGDAGDATADASPDASPDAAPDAAPDASADAAPDASADAAPDAAPDASADVIADAAVDTGADSAADAMVVDAMDDSAADAMVADAMDDSAADAMDDATMDSATDAMVADVRTDTGVRVDARTDTGVRADSATMSDASADATGAENDGVSGGGCGCRTAPTSGSNAVPSSVLAIAAVAMVLGASRRRRRAA